MEVELSEEAGSRRRSCVTGLMAAAASSLALLGLATPAQAADNLYIHSPQNNAALNAPLTDISGEMDGIDYSQQVSGFVFRHQPSGAVVNTAFFSVNNLIPVPCFCDDWAWSDTFAITSGGLPTVDGQYSVRVTQQAISGGPHIVTHSFTIDTLKPDTTIDAATPPSPTNSPTRQFTFSGTDPNPTNGFASGIGKYECALDGGAFATCTSPYTTPSLSEGNHSVAVRAVDRAGNADPTPASASWLLDLTPPSVTVTEPSEKERYLPHDTITPAFTCVDPDPDGAGGPIVPSGIQSCTPSSVDNETLGPHEFTVTAVDKAGNTTVKRVAYVIDPPRYGDFVNADHPVAYYRLGDAVGATTMVDSSGHGNDGTFKNNVALGRDGAIACTRRPHPPRVCEQAADPATQPPSSPSATATASPTTSPPRPAATRWRRG